jgi:hypothetical protein
MPLLALALGKDGGHMMELRDQARGNYARQLAFYVLMSVFSALLGGFLFTGVWSLVDEDTGVLLFFLGLPMVVGASFMLMVAISQRLFQQKLSSYVLRRAGLLAAVLAGILAVSAPRILMSVRTALPDATINLISSWMIVGIWAAALLISLVLSSALIRR